MHRYSNLVWDPTKKTFLGKNGVSWLSIILGTLVVTIGVGVFLHCVLEVKRSREESDAQMRKIILAKRLSLIGSDVSNRSNSSTGGAFEKLTPEKMAPCYQNINSSLTAPKEKSIITQEYDDLPDSSMLVRRKREVSAPKKSIETPLNFSKFEKNISKADKTPNESAQHAELGNLQINSEAIGYEFPSGNIKEENNIRFKRQFFPDYTDRTIAKESDQTDIGKLFKRETIANKEKQKVVTEHNSTSLTEAKYVGTSVVNGKRIKRHIPILSAATGYQFPSEHLEGENHMRVMRQFFPDYTDRTIAKSSHQINTEKIFKRETIANNGKQKAIRGHNSTSLIEAKKFGKPDVNGKRVKRNIPIVLANFLSELSQAKLAKLNRKKSIYKTLEDAFGKASSRPKRERIRKQATIATPIPKKNIPKRFLTRFLNELADSFTMTRFKRSPIYTAIAKLFGKKGQGMNEKCEMKKANAFFIPDGHQDNKAKHSNRFKRSTIFDKIAETKTERPKRNSTIASTLTQILNKTAINKSTENIVKRNTTYTIPKSDRIKRRSIFDKIANSKHLNRNSTISTSLTEVLNKTVKIKDKRSNKDSNLNLIPEMYGPEEMNIKVFKRKTLSEKMSEEQLEGLKRNSLLTSNLTKILNTTVEDENSELTKNRKITGDTNNSKKIVEDRLKRSLDKNKNIGGKSKHIKENITVVSTLREALKNLSNNNDKKTETEKSTHSIHKPYDLDSSEIERKKRYVVLEKSVGAKLNQAKKITTITYPLTKILNETAKDKAKDVIGSRRKTHSILEVDDLDKTTIGQIKRNMILDKLNKEKLERLKRNITITTNSSGNTKKSVRDTDLIKTDDLDRVNVEIIKRKAFMDKISKTKLKELTKNSTNLNTTTGKNNINITKTENTTLIPQKRIKRKTDWYKRNEYVRRNSMITPMSAKRLNKIPNYKGKDIVKTRNSTYIILEAEDIDNIVVERKKRKTVPDKIAEKQLIKNKSIIVPILYETAETKYNEMRSQNTTHPISSVNDSDISRESIKREAHLIKTVLTKPEKNIVTPPLSKDNDILTYFIPEGNHYNIFLGRLKRTPVGMQNTTYLIPKTDDLEKNASKRVKKCILAEFFNKIAVYLKLKRAKRHGTFEGNRTKTAQKLTVSDGPNADDYIMNLTQGECMLIRKRRI